MKRPRFSLRTMLFLVALVGLYFGCWELTKSKGLQDHYDSSPCPFVVSRVYASTRPVEGMNEWLLLEWHQEYCVWFFGKTKCVYRREVDTPDEIDLEDLGLRYDGGTVDLDQTGTPTADFDFAFEQDSFGPDVPQE